PLQADARAHRVDRLVPAVHRDLRAAADLAGDLADLHDALVDLRHLELEERRDEHGVAPRQDEAGPLGRLLDLLQHGPDGVALPEALARVLLLPRDDGLRVAGAVQHHDELAALDLLHLSGEELAHLVRELVADAVAFVLPHALHDALLDRLHGVAAELLEGHRDLHDVAHLVRLVVPARLFERDLGRGILDLIDDALQHNDVELPGVLVDVDLGLNRGAVNAG